MNHESNFDISSENHEYLHKKLGGSRRYQGISPYQVATDLSVVVYILGTFNECRHSDDINDPNEQEQPGDHHNQGFIYLRPRMCV